MTPLINSESLVTTILPSPSYKPSRFNAHTRADDGTLLLYNSLTGRNIGIPAANAEAAETLLSQRGLSSLDTSLARYLHDHGFLVEGQIDEEGRLNIKYGQDQFKSDILQLILLASEQCNFRCIYCSQEFKRDTMLPEVRQGVLRYLEKRLPTVRNFQLSWFGGEPLLGLDAIDEIAPRAHTLAQELGVKFSSTITTNGYLLTPEVSKRLVSWGVTDYQITLDGAALTHDTHRPLRDGGATFTTVLRNIVAMRDISSAFRAYVRINFDHTNVDHLTPLFENLRDQIGTDTRFAVLLFPVGKWGGPNDDALDVCGTREQAVAISQLGDEIRSFGLTPVPMSEPLQPKPNNICYAARPYNLVIGSDGKIMKCTVVLDTLPDNVVGKLLPTGELVTNEERLSKWIKPYYQNDTGCSKCFFSPVCQGVSCPLPRVTGGERPCPPPKTTIQQTLQGIWNEKRHSRSVTLPVRL